MSDMKRRDFITLLGGAAAWPLAARAQQADRMRRVGILMPFPKGDTEQGTRVRAFRQELGKLGWTDGANVQFDERWTADDMDRVRAEAASLVASNPDAIVATGGRVIPVFMQLTRSIPIVIPGAGDPLGVGWVTSLAHPGGNITGFTLFEVSILGKTLALLKQIAPAVARVAFFYNPDNPSTVVYSLSPFRFMGLPTSTVGSRAWPIARMPAFWFRPTSRSLPCARRSSLCWHGGGCRRSTRILPS